MRVPEAFHRAFGSVMLTIVLLIASPGAAAYYALFFSLGMIVGWLVLEVLVRWHETS